MRRKKGIFIIPIEMNRPYVSEMKISLREANYLNISIALAFAK